MKNSSLTVYPPVVSVPLVPNLDLAWAAGFIDGEGCVRIAKHSAKDRVNPIYNIQLTVSQNRLETLEHCQTIIGVQSSICRFPDRESFRRPVYLLTYLCANARDALTLLQPYLVRKKAEAMLALEFALRLRVPRSGRTPHTPEEIAIREEYYRRMKALK
ncbi:MAG: hypothetical protein ABIW96_07705 [Polaromonas sp.]